MAFSFALKRKNPTLYAKIEKQVNYPGIQASVTGLKFLSIDSHVNELNKN